MIRPLRRHLSENPISDEEVDWWWTPEMFRMANTRIKGSWDRSKASFFRTRGKFDFEIWIIPDGIIGYQLQENLQHTELYMCVSYLTCIYYQWSNDPIFKMIKNEYNEQMLYEIFLIGLIVICFDLIFSLLISY